ncbi:MAG: hypothetical protein WC602_02755 [archaeon]
MNGLFLTIAITFIASLAVCALVLPRLIKRMNRRGITGKDMNKLSKPKVAEMGGIAVMLGFAFSSMLAIFVFSYLHVIEINLTFFLAAIATVIIVGFLGVIDDIIGWKDGIRQYQHALIPIFAALPLMAVKVGVTSMAFPFAGEISLGIIYSLIIIPIGISGASNAFNMLAGLNGLEAGLGAIVLSTALFIAIASGSIEAAIILAAMLGAIIAFLKFNWFPAKVFPGDSLTLMMGAALAAAVIIGNMEKIGIFLVALYFAELLFKARHRFQTESFGIPQKDGTLRANPRGGSLTQWVMRRGKFTEKQVVCIILGMQLVISGFVIAYFYLNAYSIIRF